MNRFDLSHAPDALLLRDLDALFARERVTTAEMLAHIAEVDARKIYVPAGFPSMYAYCVQGRRLSEDAAYKRIQAARAARRFPVIFPAVADGRLHLSGVCLLAPYLTAANAMELLGEASRKSKTEIEELIARRFPRTESLPLVQQYPVTSPVQLAPGQVGAPPPGNFVQAGEQVRSESGDRELVPEQVGPSGEPFAATRHDAASGSTNDVPPPDTRPQLAPVQVQAPLPRVRFAPIAAHRYDMHLTVDESTYELFREAQALAPHGVGPVEVFHGAMRMYVEHRRKQKFAATPRPCAAHERPSPNPRYIPNRVRRAVWARDGGRCSFVSETGQRCPAREGLEYDHSTPVARGGTATVENIRLLCRAHNQHEAENKLGAGFMEEKRAARNRRDPSGCNSR